MKKQTAIDLFGSVKQLAYALDIRVQSIYQWDDELSRAISDRIELAMLKRNLYRQEVEEGSILAPVLRNSPANDTVTPS